MEELIAIFGICFLCATLIVIYGTFRCKVPGFKDPLTYAPVPPPWDRFFDGWGISHFLFYGLLGFLYPSRWIFITLLGILWELIEMGFKDRPFYLSKCSYDLQSDGPHAKAGWWYGRWEDIVMNSAGLFLGITLSHRIARD